MKKKKALKFYLFIIIAVFVGTGLTSAEISSPHAQQNDDRDVFICDTYNSYKNGFPNAFLPWEGSAYLNNFIYETLAGWNAKYQRYDFCIANQITWAPDGSYININIDPLAKWSGPGCQNTGVLDQIVSYNTSISSQDVKFSFEYLNNTKWGNLNTRIKNITIYDEHLLTLYLHTNSSYSKIVKKWLSSDWPILNKLVWTNISLTLMGNLSLPTPDKFQNRWNNLTDCPLKWQVSSGPYYLSDGGYHDERGIYNQDWWGERHLYPDILGPSSAKLLNSEDKSWTDMPKIIDFDDFNAGGGGDQTLNAMIQNSLDLAVAGYPDFREYMEEYPNYHVFFDDSDVRTYLSMGANIELIFNHNQFPLSEVWFRKACAYAMEYAPISTLASHNNWDRAYPNYLNKANPDHAAVWNQEVEDQYSYNTNPEKARQYLIDNDCYKSGSTWYAPVPNQNETSADLSSVIDEDPNKPGIQIQIGPYEIITPQGWTDTTIATHYWASGISKHLGIDVTETEVDFWYQWIPHVNSSTFELAMQCCGESTKSSPYEVLASIVQPSEVWNGNISGWSGPAAKEYYNKVTALETANPQDSLKIIQDLQKIYAENLPSIPSHIHYTAYEYNDYYWKGFLNSGYYYQQITTPESSDATILKQKLILSMVPSDNRWNPPIDANPMTEWPEGRELWKHPFINAFPFVTFLSLVSVLGLLISLSHNRHHSHQ